MGKAPSSLRCVAAPISSGPSVRTTAFGGSPAGGASPSTLSRPLAPDCSDVRSPTDSSDPYSGCCPCRHHQCRALVTGAREHTTATARRQGTSRPRVLSLRCTCRAPASKSSSPTRSTPSPPTWPRTWRTWWSSSRTGRRASSSAVDRARSSVCTKAYNSPTARPSTTRA